MNESEILNIVNDLGAVITNSHLVYTSGKHGSTYVNKDALYPHTAAISSLCRVLAEQFVVDNIEVVVAPALGGIILSQWIAHHLSDLMGREVLSVYAEKIEEGGFVIKRGYDKLLKDKNVLVVEDILTTGGSARKVIELTRTLGGNVQGLAVLCNRGGVTAQELAQVPKIISLLSLDFESWDEGDCPLCKQGVPVNTEVGKGREFLAKRQ